MVKPDYVVDTRVAKVIENTLLHARIMFYWFVEIEGELFLGHGLEHPYYPDSIDIYSTLTAGIDKNLTTVLECSSKHDTYQMLVPMSTPEQMKLFKHLVTGAINELTLH